MGPYGEKVSVGLASFACSISSGKRSGQTQLRQWNIHVGWINVLCLEQPLELRHCLVGLVVLFESKRAEVPGIEAGTLERACKFQCGERLGGTVLLQQNVCAHQSSYLCFP